MHELALTRNLMGKHPFLRLAACTAACLAPALSVQAQDAGAAQRAASVGAPAATTTANVPPTLDAVEVTAERPPERAGATHLSGEELSRVPGAGEDPLKAIQALPGVTTGTDASSLPAVWGASPADNIYYVDFLPVAYLFHVDGFESVLNPWLIKGFDLYAAGYGPEYGDAVGAVFDVQLRDPRTDRFGGLVDVGLLGANLLLEGPLGKDTSFYLAGRRSYFELLRKSVTDNTNHIVFQLPTYDDYQGKFVWKIDGRNRLTLHLNGAADEQRLTVQTDSPIALQDPVLGGLIYENTSDTTIAAVLDSDLGARASNKLAAGFMKDKTDSGTGSAGTIVATSDTVFAREQLRLQPAAAHALTLGADLQRARLTLDVDALDPRCTEFSPACDYTSAPLVRIHQPVRQVLADAYADDRWQWTERWAASVGVRASRDDYLDRTFVEPRLGLEWSLSRATLLSARWGRHNESPPLEQEAPVAGNPGLQHLRSDDAVLGVASKENPDLSWRAEVYRKRFADLVVADPQLNYVNAGSGTSRGLVLSLKKEPTTPWFGFVSLSFARAERRDDRTGQQFLFDYDEPVIATVVASYKPSPAWQFGARWSYHSGAPFTPVIGTGTFPDGRVRPIYGPIDSRRAPNYSRLDLRYDHLINKNLSTYLELINAYNRGNVSGYTYSANYGQAQSEYQLPRLLSAGVQYRF